MLRQFIRLPSVFQSPPAWRSTTWRLSSTARTSSVHNGISPSLLLRAQGQAAEHANLSAQQNDGYDPASAKRIGQLSAVSSALASYQQASDSLTELNTILSTSSTDPELRSLAVDDLPHTRTQLETATASLTKSLLPPHPFASLPCLIEIRPGAGGGEASIFAADLLNMYTAYCANHRLPCSVLKSDPVDSTGDTRAIAEAILEVPSPGAYGLLRSEAGVHRVQRVPATERQGRVHTSTVSVMVLPSLTAAGAAGPGEASAEDPSSDYYVDAKDVRTDVMRARGAGGQHVNTTESAVRLTHVPTGLVAAVQDERSQHKNREKAWQVLRGKLAVRRREERELEMMKMRRGVVGVNRVGREDKVRTYNWGQQRVTDHRSGVSVMRLEELMEGGLALEEIMESVRLWLSEQDLAMMDDGQ